MPQLTLLLIFLAEYFTTPKVLLFYDQIEYLAIVSTHSFWQVLTLGHFPIHPVFMAIFWLTSRLVLPNSTALIFGIASGILMYQITKIIFQKGSFWMATFMFLLFPGVWLVNTNLMVHTGMLTFYLLAILFFLKQKKILFFLTVFLMAGVHFDALYWVPTIFVLPVIFANEIKFETKEVVKFAVLAGAALLASALSYAFIYLGIRKEYGGSMEQLLAYSSFGFFRILRNIWYGLSNSFGVLMVPLLAILILKRKLKRLEWAAWIFFALAISAGGAYWQGDLMQRRIVFAGVLMALALYKYLKSKSFWIVLYLIPIIISNGILYFRDSPNMALSGMQKNIDEIPKGQVVLQSHYYQPFTKYDGDMLWIGHDNLEQIDNYLKSGKRVFITKESVTAPYLLLVGNNYHITSVGKIGNSESRDLFKKYVFEPYGKDLELKLSDGSEISDQAGEPVVFYDQGFWGRLNRRRIDYGDIGSWLWAITTNHRDPSGYTYKDVRGIWYNM